MYKALVFLIVAGVLSSCSNQPTSYESVADSIDREIAADTISKVTEELRSEVITTSKTQGDAALMKEIKENEPSAKDAVITSAHVLYVSVVADGSSKRGLAEYYCQLANEYSSTVRSVKIVKFGSTKDPKRDNAYGILLGESSCNFR